MFFVSLETQPTHVNSPQTDDSGHMGDCCRWIGCLVTHVVTLTRVSQSETKTGTGGLQSGNLSLTGPLCENDAASLINM